MTQLIEITVTGPVQSGKTAVMHTIKEALAAEGLAVTLVQREHRNCCGGSLAESHAWERPDEDRTVIALTESVSPKVG